jgi:hypothetical protein
VTRARALWLAAGFVVLACLGYLVRRRKARVLPVTAAATPAPPVVRAAPVADASTQEVGRAAEPPAIEEPAQEEIADAAPEDEHPLATWARVAIVLVALIAFFAVSLIATRHV